MTRRTLLPLVIVALLASAPPARGAEIHRAVAAGDRTGVEALLKADPSLVRVPAATRDAELPLHIAAQTGDVAMTRLLLDAGAEVDGLDVDESTPLHVAALRRKAPVVRLLLDRGADVNRRDRNGGYALSFAVAGRDTSVVRMMLQAGADLNYRSATGATLLHLAGSRGLWHLADVALARGQDVNAGDAGGSTPLHHAATVDDSARVARVIAMGARVDAVDSSHVTPLEVAMFRNAHGAARALLAAGADANRPNHDGWSPLKFAVRAADPAMLRLLLAHGADPAAPDSSAWPLARIAVETQDVELLALLLEHGMSLAPPDTANGHTALHVAALGGRADVTRLLLEHGADAGARDHAGRTALDLAVRYGHRGVAGALAAHGAPGAAGKAVAGPGPAAAKRVAAGEAAIWYLGHSGWAVKTRDHFLVFDYGRSNLGCPPDLPALCNGHVDPAELRGQRVTVFVTHEHADHFDPGVFRWRERLPGIRYVLGFRPDSAPPHLQMQPRETRTVDGMRVTAIRSNDTGVGYVVEVDGLVLFHAGDHANRRRDLTGDYTPEIEFIRAQGLRPDIAFLPISGCNFGDHVAVEIGADWTLRTLEPAMFLPMHGGFMECRYGPANAECNRRFPGIWTATVENRGDFVRYRRAG
jgi:ankyrin repeat protein